MIVNSSVPALTTSPALHRAAARRCRRSARGGPRRRAAARRLASRDLRVGQLRLGGASRCCAPRRGRARRARRRCTSFSVRSTSRCATRQLVLGRAHRRLRRLPRVVERARLDAAEQRALRTAWPSSTATCSIEPPSSARTVASRCRPQLAGDDRADDDRAALRR